MLVETKMQGELTADELFDAEKYWIKVTQQQSFGQEIKLLKAGKGLNNDCQNKITETILGRTQTTQLR